MRYITQGFIDVLLHFHCYFLYYSVCSHHELFIGYFFFIQNLMASNDLYSQDLHI